MTAVAHAVIRLARPADDELRAAVEREAGAVLASVASAASLHVTLAAGASATEIDIDGMPCRLYRERPPLADDPEHRCRGIAWQLFWQLCEREDFGDGKPALAGIGGCRREHADSVLRSLGLELGSWHDETAVDGLEPGPRLRIGSLLSPVLEAVAGGRRGDPTVAGVLRRLATRFLTPADVELLLKRMGAERPYLARTLERRYPRPLLAEVLRTLVDEGVTLNPRRLIGETLLAINCSAPAELNTEHIVFVPPVLGVAWSSALFEENRAAQLAQSVREMLKMHISAAQSSSAFEFGERWGMMLYMPELTCEVGLVHPDIEKAIDEGRFSPLDGARLAANLEEELMALGMSGQRSRVPLLTTSSCRYALWRHLSGWLPAQDVMAYLEFDPHVNIKPLFRLSL